MAIGARANIQIALFGNGTRSIVSMITRKVGDGCPRIVGDVVLENGRSSRASSGINMAGTIATEDIVELVFWNRSQLRDGECCQIKTIQVWLIIPADKQRLIDWIIDQSGFIQRTQTCGILVHRIGNAIIDDYVTIGIVSVYIAIIIMK